MALSRHAEPTASRPCRAQGEQRLPGWQVVQDDSSGSTSTGEQALLT